MTAPSTGDEVGILVTQVRSEIGTKPVHRATLRALGLRHLGASNVLPDRPEIRGMLAKVPHLVTVESAPLSTKAQKPRGRAASA